MKSGIHVWFPGAGLENSGYNTGKKMTIISMSGPIQKEKMIRANSKKMLHDTGISSNSECG